ncbi:hypothetical protein PtB15_13B527 [Puccinia triticina]|nr:hypothetical protein PtB15_13B527 [Puccinia triticina]
MARAGATLPGRPAQMAGHREEHKLASLRECRACEDRTGPAPAGRDHPRLSPAPLADARARSRPEALGPSRPRAPSGSRAPQRANGAGESQENVILYPARPGGRTAVSTTPSKDNGTEVTSLGTQPGDPAARKTPRKAGAAAHE